MLQSFFRDTFAQGKGFELWTEVCLSEGLNFWVWFLKMAPLFLPLFFVDRANWFSGGTLASRLPCGCWAYAATANYNDPRFPRCVEPETLDAHSARLSTFFTNLASRDRSLSTFNVETPRTTA